MAKQMDFEPIRLSTKQEALQTDRVPLFYIDDEEFTIPVEVPPVQSVRFLRDLKDGDLPTATAKAFDDLLGPRALNRLSRCEALKPEELKQIMDIIAEKMLAANDLLLGN
jgi:hypothetical protein